VAAGVGLSGALLKRLIYCGLAVLSLAGLAQATPEQPQLAPADAATLRAFARSIPVALALAHAESGRDSKVRSQFNMGYHADARRIDSELLVTVLALIEHPDIDDMLLDLSDWYLGEFPGKVLRSDIAYRGLRILPKIEQRLRSNSRSFNYPAVLMRLLLCPAKQVCYTQAELNSTLVSLRKDTIEQTKKAQLGISKEDPRLNALAFAGQLPLLKALTDKNLVATSAQDRQIAPDVKRIANAKIWLNVIPLAFTSKAVSSSEPLVALLDVTLGTELDEAVHDTLRTHVPQIVQRLQKISAREKPRCFDYSETTRKAFANSAVLCLSAAERAMRVSDLLGKIESQGN
jgi:hypothetical protein